MLGSRALSSLYQHLRLSDDPVVPHNPAEDGHAERSMRTLFDAVKYNTRGVDPLLWDHCAVFSGDCWNRLGHSYIDLPQYNGRSPLSVLEERVGKNSLKSGTTMLRRFGCLVYFRDQGPKTKLLPKWHRGIHLGLCPKSNGWLCGAHTNDVNGREIWGLFSSRDVKFRESVLVRGLNDLRPSSQGIFVRYNKLGALESGVPEAVPGSPGGTANSAQRVPGSVSVHNPNEPPELENSLDSATDSAQQVQEGFPPPNGRAADHGLEDDNSRGNHDVSTDNPESAAGPLKPDSRGVTLDQDTNDPGVSRKRPRGRPVGSKDRYERNRRTKAELEELRHNLSSFNAAAFGECEFEDGEDLVESHIMLPVAKALKSPDAEKWQKAISKEEARLLMFDTWEPATDEQLATADRILPIALLLTVKRCGSFKCRAVVLGNLDRSGSADTFAPVVAHGANRFLITQACVDKDEILAFDLDNAFLNALLIRSVFCRLPPIWAASHGTEIVKLKKALYGLKEAPKAWCTRYHEILTSLGWEPCVASPGIWKRASKHVSGRFPKLSVYVDDNLMTGPSAAELRDALQEILQFVSEREIPTIDTFDEFGNKWQYLDLLGPDLHYSRSARSFKITMEKYIDMKIAAKYDIKITKPVLSPNFDESALLDPEAKSLPSYPVREVVGTLQWVATIARPDVAVPVGTLAKYVP